MEYDLKIDMFKKFFSFSFGVWTNAIISFFTVPLITWLIDPAEFGKAAMYVTTYSMLLTVCLIATPSAFMRFFYEKKEGERGTLFWSSLFPTLVTWCVLLFLILLFRKQINLFLTGQTDSTVHIILSISLLLGILQAFNQAVVRIKNQGFKYSLLQIVFSISNLGFVFLYAFFLERSFLALIYAHLFANFITLVVGIALDRSFFLPVRIKRTLIKEVLIYSFPLAFASMLWWLLNWTDRLVLRMYTDFVSIGLYSAAFKVANLIGIFTTGFSNFWYPFAYEQFEKNPSNKDLFVKVFDHASFIIFTLGTGAVAAKDLIFLLFAKDYRTASHISPFLLLLPMMTTLCVIVGRGIDFSKKTYWGLLIDGVTVIFNLIGNLIFVPVLGARGAALTTGVSFILFFLIESAVSVKLYPVDYDFRKVYVVTTVFVINAFINSFVEKWYVGVLTSLVSIAMIVFVYHKVFKKTVSIVKKILIYLFGRTSEKKE